MNALPCCCGLQLTFCLTRTFRFIRQHQLPFSSVSARLPLHDPCREYTANSFPTHSVYSLSVLIPPLLFRFITDTSNYSVLRPTCSEFLVENSTPLVIGQFCNHFHVTRGESASVFKVLSRSDHVIFKCTLRYSHDG
jgi:hypothetical protein